MKTADSSSQRKSLHTSLQHLLIWCRLAPNWDERDLSRNCAGPTNRKYFFSWGHTTEQAFILSIALFHSICLRRILSSGMLSSLPAVNTSPIRSPCLSLNGRMATTSPSVPDDTHCGNAIEKIIEKMASKASLNRLDPLAALWKYIINSVSVAVSHKLPYTNLL